MPKFNMNWIYALVIISLAVAFFATGKDGGLGNTSVSVEKDYTQFVEYVNKGWASRVVINKNESTLKMYVRPEHINDIFKAHVKQTGPEPYVVVEIGSVDNLETMLNQAIKTKKITGFSYNNEKGNVFTDILLSLLPWVLLIAFWMWMMRRMSGGGGGAGGIFNVGKSKAKLYEKADELNITFKDVAGQEGAKQEVQEIVEFLKNPKKYTDVGGKIPKGALLIGPPGTGKTLLAKAVAGEAAVPFFSMSGSDFVEMFVGVGASRVRDVFKQAKEKAPCIIFIDEIDAVGRARSKNPAMGGNDERENTLNALLTEMDGFGSNSGVIVLAATNRVDMLDKALLRAGRFDRQIRVDLPDLPERKAIFQVHMKPLKLDKNIDLDLLARQTPGFSGADIANVCNEAALIAARHDKKEKRTIAIHEAGHATVSWFCEFANPLIKVTIVPRGQALGAAWYMPEERPISTKEQMLDEMCSLLGGRAAEQLFTGHISTGAMNDLERATKAAFSMVTYYGMSDKLPNICYYDNSEYGFQKPYSEKTACLIDEEVLKIVNQLYDRAKQILDEHKEGHAQLAQLLVDKEVVMAEDVERIFGKRPWSSRTQELMAEEEKNELRLENMPEAVRKAQEEHEKAEAEKDDHAEDDTEDKEKE